MIWKVRTGREVSVFVHRAGHVLLLKRARDGIWHIPAGVVERGESFSAAAARELEEETGLRAAQVMDLACEQRYRAEPRSAYAPGVTEVTLENFAVEAHTGWEPVLDDEHTDSRWVPLRSVSPLLHWENTREACEVLINRLGRGERPK